MPESPGAQRLTMRWGLACLCSVFLLWVPLWSTAQADSSHIQQSVELMSTDDLAGAEKEARLALTTHPPGLPHGPPWG